MKMFYTKPANDWESEALPIGNGYIAGMVFGGLHIDHIQINEHTLWSGGPGKNNNYSEDIYKSFLGVNQRPDSMTEPVVRTSAQAKTALRSLQELLQSNVSPPDFTPAYKNAEGKIITMDYPNLGNDNKNNGPISDAQQLFQTLMGNKSDFGSYQTLSDIYIKDPNLSGAALNPNKYKRGLDLDNGIAFEEYTLKGIICHKEYFTSFPDNVMVIRLTASVPGSLSREFSIASLRADDKICAESDTITLTGIPSDHNPSYANDKKLRFAQQMKVISKGGTTAAKGNVISVAGADEILILMTAGTNYIQCADDTYNYFSGEDPLDSVKARIALAAAKGYDELYKSHADDYSELFSRVNLDLCGAEFPENKPTDELLKGYQDGTNTVRENRYLEMLYYQFGRYLLISSSREGSLPANLQGIWAKGLSNPWDADYHTNINLQMNYWLTQQTNLGECHQPVIDYIKSLVPRGTETAQFFHQKQNGGDVRGWTTYHENNIWGYAVPGVSGAFYSPTAAAWLCKDLWEQYAFTMDENILQSNYQTMLDAALFWVDFLWKDERDGTLVANPSYSPEHGPISLGATTEQAIIWELFEDVIKASKILGKASSELDEIKDAQSKMYIPFSNHIGLNGQYMEWKDETTQDVSGDGGHRHVNHLYSLHPGSLVITGRGEEDNRVSEAMKVTLNTRGDGGTGWSKAWKINFWARLHDGDHAGVMVNQILKESTLSNLFDTHPPFQIDGNFGATAGMTEMLLQSQGDSIDLLPALPAMWDSGSVKGIKARGNFQIALEWSECLLQKASVKSFSGTACAIKYAGLAQSKVKKANGEDISFTAINNDKISFETVKGEVYIITFENL